jgi:translation initiation factor IF-1
LKEDVVELLPGRVIAVHRGACHVALDAGPTILAHLAGRMMFHKIHMVAGDRVEVAMSHYDHSRELPPRLLTLVRKLVDGGW